MDKVRTLPPLVRGKVTGVLNFFVHEITIFRNLLLADNFDLVLQVQWWGESLPTHIRPKKINVQSRSKRNPHSLDSYHCAKYEVKTTLDLLKSYLKTCEKVELCVLEAVQNFIIGSAFLTEVINFLNNNNKFITLPIYDYLGEVIGEVTLHITYFEEPCQEDEQNQYINNKSNSDDYLKKMCNEKDGDVLSRIDSNCFTLAEKTLIYNVNANENLKKKDLNVELEPVVDTHDFMNNKDIIKLNKTQSFSSVSNTLVDCQEMNMSHKSTVEKKKYSCKCFPEITILNDSSKILNFGIASKLPTVKDDIKSYKTQLINKYSSNSIKCKSKSESTKRLSNFTKTKKCSVPKNSPTKVTSKLEFDIKNTSFDKVRGPEMCECYIQTNFQSIPTKKSPNYNILNYLLGSDMSKDDEEIALNDFKKMSPSHNLVDSIGELCLVSNKNAQVLQNKNYTEVSVSSAPNHLNFDLSNPIERNYYEKFFLKSKCTADFEVAEFLNQPEGRVIVDKVNFSESLSYKSGSHSNTISEFSHSGKEIGEGKVKEICSMNEINICKQANNCSRCKYFKKLDELDTIIESLKHFEEKMRKYEKDLKSSFKENPDALIKINQRGKHS